MSTAIRATWRFVVLIGLGLALVGATPAAQKEEVRIAPWYDEVTVGPGQEAVIRWGWGNCTRGLTDDWVNATVHRYTLKRNGVVVQEISAQKAEKYWSAPYVTDGQIELCVWPAQNTWASIWEYDKLKLNSPGDYELEVYVFLEEPLIDGYDMDQDGQADWYDGLFYDRTVVIHVVK